MAFLGEVPDRRQEAAARAVAAGVTDRRGRGGAPIIELGGSGALGRARLNPMCVGVLGDVEGLRDLATALRARLRAVGLPYDGRPMRPHLTLARPGDRLSVADTLADREILGQYRGPSWVVDEVRLMRSELGPHPVHTLVGAWSLIG
jgi:2'-5' RNA ligase